MSRLGQDSFLRLHVHETVHPDRIRRQVENDLLAGVVPTKLLYGTPRQARKWQELASTWSPAMRSDDGAQAYEAIHTAAAALGKTMGSPLILGIGCGDGRKEVALAKALGRNVVPSFMPMDASLPLVQVACSVFEETIDHEEISPVLIDLERPGKGLVELLEAGPERGVRILTLYGVLPWMNPLDAIDLCKSLMRPDDLLCVSANLAPAGGNDEVLAQYENEQSRSWLWLLLEQLEIETLSESLTIQMDEDRSGFASLVLSASLEIEEGTSARFEGKPIALESGGSLRVLRSARFSPTEFQDLLERCSLSVEEMAVSSSGQEAVALTRL